MATVHNSLADIRKAIDGVLALNADGTVTVRNVLALRDRVADGLVWTGVFATDTTVRDAARWLTRAAAIAQGAFSASVHHLYMAVPKGEIPQFTTPAINIRGFTYKFAQTVMEAAEIEKAGPVIFEIAKSEIGYTNQAPAEYAHCILGAALKSGYVGPVFIQGDHFQFKMSNFKADAAKETESIKKLTKEAIEAEFYNIDIDASTLVTLEPTELLEQQKWNSEQTAALTTYIREIEPEGVTVSIGGEIGEVGEKNSTPEELAAFMEGYRKNLNGLKAPGISKVSVQTGTSHGGVPMPDGTITDVKLDLDALHKISIDAKKRHAMGGAVQHGASTLPDQAFHNFVTSEAVEVHLATAFQNMAYDHASFPNAFRAEIYAWFKASLQGERKSSDSEEQFIYKSRKKGFGPFKRQWWDLADSASYQGAIDALRERFRFLMRQLAVSGKRAQALELAKARPVQKPAPEAFKQLLAAAVGA
jgi:fructose/tagatose bisphosphate aldolase